MGLLDALTDPFLMAEIQERARLVSKIAEQMGVSDKAAWDALYHFEAIASSEGQTVQ